MVYYVVVVWHPMYGKSGIEFIPTPNSGWVGVGKNGGITPSVSEAMEWVDTWERMFTGDYTYKIVRIDETEL